MPVMTNTETKEFLNRSLIATLVTLRQDGSPHASPMWYMYQDGKFYSGTGRESLKVRNIQRDDRVSLCISTHDEPYQYIVVDGTCEIVKGDAKRMSLRIGARYLGEKSANAFSEAMIQRIQRGESVMLVITPTKILTENNPS